MKTAADGDEQQELAQLQKSRRTEDEVHDAVVVPLGTTTDDGDNDDDDNRGVSPPLSSPSLKGLAVCIAPETLKRASLVLLVFQNCAAVLLTHAVEARRGSSAKKFSTAIANSITELIKFSVCLCLGTFFHHQQQQRENVMANDEGQQEESFDAAEKSANRSREDHHHDDGSSSLCLVQQLFSFLRTVFDPSSKPLQMIVPAAIYTVENLVFFVALANLQPTIFQVVYQSKILFTAIMLMLMLDRRLSQKRWLALCVIVVGIVLTQINNNNNSKHQQQQQQGAHHHHFSGGGSASAADVVQAAAATAGDSSSFQHRDPIDVVKKGSWISGAFGGGGGGGNNNRSNPPVPSVFATAAGTTMAMNKNGDDDDDSNSMNFALGIAATLTCSLCSAFACAYFESCVKCKNSKFASTSSVLVRNVQLATFSFGLNLCVWFFFGGHGSSSSSAGGKNTSGGSDNGSSSSGGDDGIFTGFTPLVVVLVFVQAFGGLLISAAIKFADSVSKSISTAVAIVVNGVLSTLFFHFHPSLLFLMGGSMVIFATVMYARN